MIPEITPEQSLEWKEREKQRLEDGTYTPLPIIWRCSSWFQDGRTKEFFDEQSGNYLRSPKYPDHFAHISIDRVAMIAFTENEQKGVRDRQTRINPGKYLAKFFSDYLSKEDIQYLATQMGAEYNDDAELKFAVTADEIEEAYTSGPTSCMSHGASHFESETHPVRVYAGFDLQLAYLKREDRITARALCWPEKKIYGRVYGDETRLVHLLAEQGYEKGSLHGARITKLMQGGAYVIPFLDYLQGAFDAGKHLVLCERLGGKRVKLCCGGGQQNGLSSDPSPEYTCYACEEGVDEDDAREVNNRYYCESCFDDRFSRCERSGDYVYNDDLEEVRTIRGPGGSWVVECWGDLARNHYAFWCEHDEVWYATTGNSMYSMHGGRMWGPEAFERGGIRIDGVNYDKADLSEGVMPLVPEIAYDEVKVNQAALPLDPAGEITVDCWVVALDSIEGEFTAGRTYKVSALVDDGYDRHLSFYADDSGNTNGWTRDKFRLHTPASRQTGLHIRHTPAEEVWPFAVYDGNRYIDAYEDKNGAEARLCALIDARRNSAQQPEEVA